MRGESVTGAMQTRIIELDVAPTNPGSSDMTRIHASDPDLRIAIRDDRATHRVELHWPRARSART